MEQSNTKSPIHLEENGTILTNDKLVTTLNQFFLSVNDDVPYLDLHSLPAFLPAADQSPTIHPYQVCKKLINLNPFKATGPDTLHLASSRNFLTNCLTHLHKFLTYPYPYPLPLPLLLGSPRIFSQSQKKHLPKKKVIYAQTP